MAVTAEMKLERLNSASTVAQARVEEVQRGAGGMDSMVTFRVLAVSKPDPARPLPDRLVLAVSLLADDDQPPPGDCYMWHSDFAPLLRPAGWWNSTCPGTETGRQG